MLQRLRKRKSRRSLSKDDDSCSLLTTESIGHEVQELQARLERVTKDLAKWKNANGKEDIISSYQQTITRLEGENAKLKKVLIDAVLKIETIAVCAIPDAALPTTTTTSSSSDNKNGNSDIDLERLSGESLFGELQLRLDFASSNIVPIRDELVAAQIENQRLVSHVRQLERLEMTKMESMNDELATSVASLLKIRDNKIEIEKANVSKLKKRQGQLMEDCIRKDRKIQRLENKLRHVHNMKKTNLACPTPEEKVDSKKDQDLPVIKSPRSIIQKQSSIKKEKKAGGGGGNGGIKIDNDPQVNYNIMNHKDKTQKPKKNSHNKNSKSPQPRPILRKSSFSARTLGVGIIGTTVTEKENGAIDISDSVHELLDFTTSEDKSKEYNNKEDKTVDSDEDDSYHEVDEHDAIQVPKQQQQQQQQHQQRSLLKVDPTEPSPANNGFFSSWNELPKPKLEPNLSDTDDTASFNSACGDERMLLKKGGVAFQSVNIRCYDQIAGDNPSCSGGTPISLGWRYNELEPIKLDDYENARNESRRAGKELYLSSDERRRVLQHNYGYSDDDLDMAAELAKKLRQDRAYSSSLFSKLKVNVTIRDILKSFNYGENNDN